MENLKRARVQDGPRAILRFLASLPPPTRHSFKLSPPPLQDVRLPVTEAKRRQAPEERPGAVTVTAGPLGRSTKPSRGPLHPPSAAAT